MKWVGHLYTIVFQGSGGSRPGHLALILSYTIMESNRKRDLSLSFKQTFPAERKIGNCSHYHKHQASLPQWKTKWRFSLSVLDGLNMVLPASGRIDQRTSSKDLCKIQHSVKLRLLSRIPPIYLENGHKWHLITRMYLLQNWSPAGVWVWKAPSPFSVVKCT